MLFACALVEKLYTQGHCVYVDCDDKVQADYFNDLLWCYKSASFVPHGLSTDVSLATQDYPVQIGYMGIPSTAMTDVMISLAVSTEPPSFYQQFSRIVEVVNQDETIKTALRTRYQYYRAHGHDIKTHAIA